MATTENKDSLLALGRTAQKAARALGRQSTEAKNQALLNVAEALESEQGPILEANRLDYDAARAEGMDEAMLDRLLLTPDRLKGMAGDVRTIASLPDPVDEVIEAKTLPNGLEVERRRVPLGVIGSIYESRPNVTIDIAALTLKSGNACLLRGGKESLHSNLALTGLLRRAIGEAGIDPETVQYVDNPDRSLVDAMLQMKEYIDLLVPRGGQGLIKFVAENAAMPVVAGESASVTPMLTGRRTRARRRTSFSMPRCSDLRSAMPWIRCCSTRKRRRPACRTLQETCPPQGWNSIVTTGPSAFWDRRQA